MPVGGARLKPPGQSVTRHKPLEWAEVPDLPFKGGPKLPPTQPDGLAWPPTCKRRWAIWSTMPHCVLWSKADWQFALDTMSIAARFVISAQTTDAAEMRCREKVLGTTHDYRRGLRIRYVEPALGSAEDVTKLDDSRDL